MIGAQSAYVKIIHSQDPQTDFKSGWDQGIADASEPCNRYPYVWHSLHGFINQTDSWMDGKASSAVCR